MKRLASFMLAGLVVSVAALAGLFALAALGVGCLRASQVTEDYIRNHPRDKRF